MNTTQTNREVWRKFLGIKDQSSSLENGRTGGVIGRTAGRAGGAGGGGALDSDSVPEGSDDEESAEKGDGGADAGNRLKPGDDADRLEDLYDCETNEKVTVDGLGKEGSEKYPSGFEDCKPQEIDPTFETGFYFQQVSTTYKKQYPQAVIVSSVITTHQTRSEAVGAVSVPKQGDIAKLTSDFLTSGIGGNAHYDPNPSEQYTGERYNVSYYRSSCSSNPSAICNLPPPKPKWPAPDKNHLNWNKEKGCFEPLCPELNTAVSDKFKACEPERILCDKDGNKVKVTVDGDTVKVTQAKYNQTAEIKNGKVQTVKKLSESQTEAEFK